MNPLAQGGQKKVLAGDHPDFGPIVIKYGQYGHTVGLERITREVALLRNLQSPYYPEQYEFLIDPIGQQFMVAEERLDAVELGSVMQRFSSDSEALSLLMHLLCALQVVWNKNVVHRDVKPANILITPSGEPRVIDLGIARFLDDSSLTATLAGQDPGTPIYAAPEQLLNRKAMINFRTDLFLIGMLILELIHGFHPFDPKHVGNNMSIVDNILNGAFVPVDSSRDGRLVGFLARALETQSYKRFRTVEAVFNHFGVAPQSC